MNSVEGLARTARRLRATSLAKRGRAGKHLPAVLFFTDPLRTADAEAVIATLPRGSGVVFRAFGAPDALALGRRLAAAARRGGLRFWVGADVGLAVALKAYGVHLPQRLAGRAGVHRAIRRRFCLTAAAHDGPAVARLRRAGVDALVISPVFSSRSPSAGRPLGVMAFARLARQAALPVYALGGVNAASAKRLGGSGAAGVAAIDGLIV